MTLAETLVRARQRGRESAEGLGDTGMARRDAVLLVIARSDETEAAITEAGLVVEWYEGTVGKGYVIEPDVQSMGFPRTAAVLEMTLAVRAGGFAADHLFRSYESCG